MGNGINHPIFGTTSLMMYKEREEIFLFMICLSIPRLSILDIQLNSLISLVLPIIFEGLNIFFFLGVAKLYNVASGVSFGS